VATPSRSPRTAPCPGWCVGHRRNDSGSSVHTGEMRYAGGMYVGVQQTRRGRPEPMVAIFRSVADRTPVAELDEFDATELAEALLDARTELEAAKRVDGSEPRHRGALHGVGRIIRKIPGLRAAGSAPVDLGRRDPDTEGGEPRIT
jgi:hypothetical protein